MIHPRFRALWLIPVVLLPALAGPSYAGIFFNRKSKKPTPIQRVPELVTQIKTDGDESKRAAAAQELREYDTAQFPMIVPVLIDALLTDPKPTVRATAAKSLGKIRPISQHAGMALEQALANDSSTYVKLIARSSLLQYHWSGYRSSHKDELMAQTKEPPLADEKGPPVINTTTLPPINTRFGPRPGFGTNPPPAYGSTPPAPFPFVPTRPRVSQTSPVPPLRPLPLPTVTPPQQRGNESGPDLTPPGS